MIKSFSDINYFMKHRSQLIIFSVLFLVLFILNSIFLKNTSVGVVLLVSYFVVFGWELGGVITQSEKAILRWWPGAWLLLSVILIILSVCYYAAAITPEVVYTVVLLTPALMLWLCRHKTRGSVFDHFHNLWHEKRHKIPNSVLCATTVFSVVLILFFSTITSNQITDSVRSVWERLPHETLLLFMLAVSLCIALLWRGKERAVSLMVFSFLLFAFLCVAALAFPIGYGFDSFIHKATETYLAEYGTITPKPFYYIGQYALILFVHHGFNIPINTADTFLVPILTAILLPCAWFFAAVHITRKRSISMLSTVGIFILPLSSFIVTTPQALANLWTLLFVLASVPYLLEKEHPRLLVLAIACLATLFIHPIAGIPLMLYFMFLATDPSRTNPRTPKTNRFARLILISVACVILPLSFFINALMSGQKIGINTNAINPIAWLSTLNFSVFFENRFEPILDLVYLWGQNSGLIILAIATLAWIGYHKELSRRFRAIILIALAISVNYLIMSTLLEFTFLIDYERANYAQRLVPLVFYFLSPFVILGLSHVFINLKSEPFILRASAFILLVAIAGSNFYLLYPRRDAYETSRGFNVGQSDIDAVRLAESMSDNKPYIALANQSVSAAAIKEIGFKYFDDMFFYPIPTGGKLYDSFLKMNETPTRETARDALETVSKHSNVQTLFFLVNNYWWEAPRIIETAKTTADDWKSVGEGGQVFIFKYSFEQRL